MPARDYGPQFESATYASTAANTPWKTFESTVSNSDPEAISICKTHPSRQVSFRGLLCGRAYDRAAEAEAYIFHLVQGLVELELS
jgi:hypothetical protein